MTRFHATSNGLVPFTPEEEAERDAEEAAWAAGENDRLASAAREKRDALLAATDWFVVKALETGRLSEYSSVMVYRQDLRDIPSQPGFPCDIDWPSIDTIKV